MEEVHGDFGECLKLKFFKNSPRFSNVYKLFLGWGFHGNKMATLHLEVTLLKLKIREVNALKAEATAWEVYKATGAADAYRAALAAEEVAIEAAQALELF